MKIVQPSLFDATTLWAMEPDAVVMEKTTPAKRYSIPQIQLTFVRDTTYGTATTCNCSETLAKTFREDYEAGEMDFREITKVIYLNRRLKVIGIQTVGVGSDAACIVDAKALFSGALLCRAHAVALCHNHPSGTLQPSVQDDKLTRKVADGAKLLDMQFLDHIILTSEDYYSYRDNRPEIL